MANVSKEKGEIKKKKKKKREKVFNDLHLQEYWQINVNVHVYSPDIPAGSADYNLHPWYWNTLFNSLIPSGGNSAFVHFAAAIANHYNLTFSFHQVPITAGWTEAA